MKSILIVQLKRLGDLILTTPALAALREKHPGSQVTLLIDQYSRDLVPALGRALHAVQAEHRQAVVNVSCED